MRSPDDSLSPLPPPRTERLAKDGRHLLVEAPREASVQMHTLDGTAAAGTLAVVIPWSADLPARIAALLDAWHAFHGKPPSNPLTPQRRRRLILGLRALDGRDAGASYRELAAGLFGADRVPRGPAWKTHDLRSRTMRLVADATALMRGGYRALVGLPPAA